MENPLDPLTAAPPAEKLGRRGARMSPEARKSDLLARAIEYFSEEGFDGGTRALARRTGITQPLIYRYFPSKEDLINAVYEAVYLAQWKDDWTAQLCDRTAPLPERLTAFYHDYARTIFNRTWMRIFFFAGLKGLDINTRYINRVISDLLVPICRETRAHLGRPSDGPVTESEIELVWVMHGAIFYHGIREHVYGLPGQIDHDRTAAVAIKMFLAVAKTDFPAAITPPLTEA